MRTAIMLQFGGACIVAHSIGCTVAAKMAASRPLTFLLDIWGSSWLPPTMNRLGRQMISGSAYTTPGIALSGKGWWPRPATRSFGRLRQSVSFYLYAPDTSPTMKQSDLWDPLCSIHQWKSYLNVWWTKAGNRNTTKCRAILPTSSPNHHTEFCVDWRDWHQLLRIWKLWQCIATLTSQSRACHGISSWMAQHLTWEDFITTILQRTSLKCESEKSSTMGFDYSCFVVCRAVARRDMCLALLGILILMWNKWIGIWRQS